MRFYIILITLSYLFFENSYGRINNIIIVKVGSKIITNYEIKNKILTSLVLSNQEINQESINKLKKQSLETLIEKKIKEIELERYKFETDKKRVETYLNRISSNNIENLKRKFKNNNISFSIFLSEIETQFKWQQLILNSYNKQVKIDEDVVNKEIKKIIKKSKKTLELKLSEIEISINNNDSDQEKILNIQKLINEIGFENVALKFSISPSSDAKGDIGWINSNTLTKKVWKIIENLKVGEVSEPIFNPNSVTILKLIDKRVSDTKDLNIENVKKNLINRKKNELYNLYSQSLLSKLKNQTLIQYFNE